MSRTSKNKAEKLTTCGGSFYQHQIAFINQHKGDGFAERTRAVVDKAMNADCAVEAIKYALHLDLRTQSNGILFLQYWTEGDFEKLKASYPDAPDSVYPKGGV